MVARRVAGVMACEEGRNNGVIIVRSFIRTSFDGAFDFRHDDVEKYLYFDINEN